MPDNHEPGTGGPPEAESCHYIPEMVVVPRESSDRARTALSARGFDPGEWETGELSELLGGLTDGELETLQTRLDTIKVADPHGAALAARTYGGVSASIVHGLGFMGHARALSGEGPDQAEAELSGNAVGVDAPIVAVVDTGIVDEEARSKWEWMLSPSVEAEPEDIESPDQAYRIAASHGTFVVSLLRQNAPDHAVWISAAKPTPMETDETDHDDSGAQPTSELNVFVAIHRLLSRLEGSDREVSALNLSLGAHSDRPCEDDFLLTVRLALADWREVYPEVPILAAGGNVSQSIDPNPVYPGAFDSVTAVAARDENEQEIVWVAPNRAGRRNGSGRSWIDNRALGVDLVGLSGNPASPVISWGGSSFATALHTASQV